MICSTQLHNTVQYVDDSNNIVSSKNINELQTYINKYFTLLEGYYNLNKLTLNSDKTKFMIICKPSLRHLTTQMVLKTTN